MKDTLRYLSTLAILAAIAITLYVWLGQAFTLPLGLLAIIAALSAVWLQGESK